MPRTKRQPEEDHRHFIAELIRMRRAILQYARSTPPGAERNRHRQVAESLRRIFKNKAWLGGHKEG
jgi:hypothetical protein